MAVAFEVLTVTLKLILSESALVSEVVVSAQLLRVSQVVKDFCSAWMQV